MKTTLCFMLLLTFPGVANCQTAPTFKGHRISETVVDFSQTEPIGKCVGSISGPEPHYSDKEVKEMRRNGTWPPPEVSTYYKCKDAAFVSGNHVILDELIYRLHEHVDTPAGATWGEITWTFTDGKLTEMSGLVRQDYSVICADMTAKLHTKAVEGKVVRQNGFGATWDDFISVWDTADVHATVATNNNPADHHFPTVTIESEAQYQTEEKLNTKKGNALD